nr:PREDICTED: rho GTPase-activating protein 1-like [Opisthocomus hoazin]
MRKQNKKRNPFTTSYRQADVQTLPEKCSYVHGPTELQTAHFYVLSPGPHKPPQFWWPVYLLIVLMFLSGVVLELVRIYMSGLQILDTPGSKTLEVNLQFILEYSSRDARMLPGTAKHRDKRSSKDQELKAATDEPRALLHGKSSKLRDLHRSLDFLQNIPSKFLSADLYDKWMQALEKSNKQEKLQELKEVAAQLPRPNLVLLKHLLSLLHHISQNAEISRMDSSNLAICVGPNMLSPETDNALPLEVQKEINDKVC